MAEPQAAAGTGSSEWWNDTHALNGMLMKSDNSAEEVQELYRKWSEAGTYDEVGKGEYCRTGKVANFANFETFAKNTSSRTHVFPLYCYNLSYTFHFRTSFHKKIDDGFAN